MDELHFKPVDGNAPDMSCNYCGLSNPLELCAEHPMDEDILICVCSNQCAENLKKMPGLEEALSELWNSVQIETASKEYDLQELMDWNYAFAKRVFPKHCDDPVPPLHHLLEEVKETIDELSKDESDDSKTLKEYADCLILLAGSAKRKGFSAHDLLRAAYEKMEINEARDWGEPDENGVYHHKKGGQS